MKGQVSVFIRAIDGSETNLVVDRRCSGKAIWDAYTQMQNIRYPDFFGLRFDATAGKGVKLKAGGGSYSIGKQSRHWLSTNEPAEHQLGTPKKRAGVDGRARWDLEFLVRFYVDRDLLQIWCNKARILFYMQLRDDVFSRHIQMSDDQLLFLASLASQVHLGDWNAVAIRDQSDYLAQIDDPVMKYQLVHAPEIAMLHKKHATMEPMKAMMYYIEFVSQSPFFGMEIHECLLNGENCKLGVSPSGLSIVTKPGEKNEVKWTSVKNITNKSKKLSLVQRCEHAPDITTVFNFESKHECKNFWVAAVQQHTFFHKSEETRKQIEAQKPLSRNVRRLSGAARPQSYLQKDPARRTSSTGSRQSLADITQENVLETESIGGKASCLTIDEDESARIESISGHSPVIPLVMLQEDISDGMYFDVTLILDDKRALGFSIAGGVPSQNEDILAPIYVQEITVDGTAHKNGVLNGGDCILSINGHSLEGKLHSEAVRLIAEITSSTNHIILQVWRDNELAHYAGEASTLTDRDANSVLLTSPGMSSPSLGKSLATQTFSLAGGAEHGTGLFFTAVQLDTNIRAGDELIAICGEPVEGMTVNEAFAKIHEADAANLLQLEVVENEEGFAKLAEIMRNSEQIENATPVKMGIMTPVSTVKSQRRTPIAGKEYAAADDSAKSTTDENTPQLALKEACVPSMQSLENLVPTPPFTVRACFNLDFESEGGTKGLRFKIGDVLKISKILNENYWQGHLVTKPESSGTIPSTMYALQYLQDTEAESTVEATTANNQVYDIMVEQRIQDLLAKSDAVRPIALFGKNVDSIAGEMVSIAEAGLNDVCHPVFHTTRPPRPNERSGVDYHYISEEDMKQGLSAKVFVEAGSFEGHLYALSFADIIKMCRLGKSVILQTKFKGIARLLSSTGLKPIVVRIADDSSDSGDINDQFGGWNPLSIRVAATVAETAKNILKLVRHDMQTPYFIKADQRPAQQTLNCHQSLTFTTSTVGSQSKVPNRVWVAPLTTRMPRENETDGKEYHFVSKSEFQAAIESKQLQEWGYYKGEMYGIPRSDNKPNPLFRSKTLATALLDPSTRQPSASARSQSLKVAASQSKNALADKTRSHPSRKSTPSKHSNSTMLLNDFQIKRSLSLRGSRKNGSRTTSPYDYDNGEGELSDYSSACSPVESLNVSMTPYSFLNQVILVRSNSSFGFTVTGGVDFGELPSISKISNVSTVESTICELAVGDQILAINDTCLATATHDQIIHLLRSAGEMVSLTLFPAEFGAINQSSASMSKSQQSQVATVLIGTELDRLEAGPRGFGFTVEAIQTASSGVYIASVLKGSEAEEEYLVEGMQLLTLWGTDVSALSVDRVRGMLSMHDKVSLVARGKLDPSIDTTKSFATRTVTLVKHCGSYGLRVGVEKDHITKILKINPGSAADGIICESDQILTINGISAVGSYRKDALNCLAVCDRVVLEVSSDVHNPYMSLSNETLITIEISHGDNSNLGLQLAAMREHGVFIERIVDSSIAASNGNFRPGDILVNINNTSVYNYDLGRINSLLQSTVVKSIKVLRGQIRESRQIEIVRCEEGQSLGMKVVLAGVVKIASVVGNGLADRAGVPAGCQLVKVNNIYLEGKTYKEIRSLLCQWNNVMLEIIDGH